MATTLSSHLPDPGGCLICQRLALAVVLVDLANTSKEIIPCFSITARFAGSHRSLRPDTARLPVQSVPVAIRQRQVVNALRMRGVCDNVYIAGIMTNPPSLGEFEQVVLLAVLRLGENAYGVSIRAEIGARTGRKPAPGALYTALDRMEEKRFVQSRWGDPTPQRGGRAKRYF